MRLRFGPVRDVVLLVSGLALMFNEAVLQPEPRLIIMAAAGGMIGLPATLFADRRFAPQVPPKPDPSTVAPQQPGPQP